jgi:methylmalonyl-CoA mutase cobalamin-binding subunit
VAQIFGPGTPIKEIVDFIRENLPEGKDDNQD